MMIHQPSTPYPLPNQNATHYWSDDLAVGWDVVKTINHRRRSGVF